MKTKALNYTNLLSILSLRDGIEEFRKLEVQQDEAERLADDLIKDINEHDAIHTLFGCTADLKGEILAHVWTYFGTTTDMEQMKRVNRHEDHKQALREIGHLRLMRTWFFNIPSIIATIRNAKKMHKKFPAADYKGYLDAPLKEIREEFNIKF